MASQENRFLDVAGTQRLWGNVVQKIASGVEVERERAEAQELYLEEKIDKVSGEFVNYYDKAEIDTQLEAQKNTNEKNYVTKTVFQQHEESNIASFLATEKAVKELKDAVAALNKDGEANVIEIIKVNNVALVPDEQLAVNITIPVAISELEGHSLLVEQITALQDKDKTIDEAIVEIRNLNSKTNEAIVTVQNEVDVLSEKVANNTQAIVAAEEKAQTALDASILIAKEQEALTDNLNLEKASREEEDKNLLSLINLNAGKIVAIENKIGELPEDKTIIEIINEISLKGYDDTEIRNLIATEEQRAKTAEEENLNKINQNSENIIAITNKLDIGDKTVTQYVEDSFANLEFGLATTEKPGLVKASEEISVGEDGSLGVGYISTDKLIQGLRRLILDGGD